MNTLTKLALGMMGRLQSKPSEGDALGTLVLPPADTFGGMGLMDALRRRQSQREFLPEPLSPQTLSNLSWAACGVNRVDLGGRTAPSAMNAQEVDLYLALPQGLYQYKPQLHLLRQVVAQDVRRVTGYQDFVDNAPLDLIFVADHTRMALVPAAQRVLYCAISAGAMAQNIALYCASAGLANVVRAWFDRDALARAMQLGTDHQILLTQTIGQPKRPGA
jgi:SagB-type dehydrogenase family enzyme